MYTAVGVSCCHQRALVQLHSHITMPWTCMRPSIDSLGVSGPSLRPLRVFVHTASRQLRRPTELRQGEAPLTGAAADDLTFTLSGNGTERKQNVKSSTTAFDVTSRGAGAEGTDNHIQEPSQGKGIPEAVRTSTENKTEAPRAGPGSTCLQWASNCSSTRRKGWT